MLKFFLLLIVLAVSVRADEAQLAIARQNLEDATKLIKENPHSNLAKILSLLTESKNIFLKETKLSKTDEVAISKVCSHIYWLSKFSTLKDVHKTEAQVTEAATETSNSLNKDNNSVAKVEDLAWQKLKAEKEKAFQDDLKNVQEMEAKLKNDPLTNMLNYLNLQVKVIDLEKALEIKAKTEGYNAELMKERDEILTRTKLKIKDYDNLLTNKIYDEIFVEIMKLIQSKKVDAKDYSVVRMLAMEMKAMVTIKERLLAQGDNCAILLPRILDGMTGVVTAINEKGIRVLTDEKQISFLYWNIVSEQTIISLCLGLLNESTDEDLYILGLANLRQEDYESAYKYFKKLTNTRPENYERYRDYLSMCETGYRLKYASKFEQIFAEIDKMSQKGQRKSAIEKLMEFKNDYLNSDLGGTYMERFKLVYNDVIRR